MTQVERVVLDPVTTALVVIDLQTGIMARPCEPHAASAVLGNSIRMAVSLRSKGGYVVLVRVAFSPDYRDAPRPVVDDPAMTRTAAPPADFADLSPELGPRPGDHIVTKRQWGAFYGTDLELQLRRRGITTIVLCGIATCFGVESTARSAYEHGYQLVFAEDAMSSMAAVDHQHTITRIFPRLGRVRSTADILAALAQEPAVHAPGV